MRDFIEQVKQSGDLVQVHRPVSVKYELANVANALAEKPVLFEHIHDYAGWRVLSGQCASRRYFSMSLNIPVANLLHHLANALENPQPPPIVNTAPCQELVADEVDLMKLPALLHLPQDAGHYIASNVVITEDPEFGRNMCYHRLLRLDEKRFTARIIERRGTYNAMQKVDGDLPIAICIGVSSAVHLAAAMSPPPQVDELAVAHALAPTPLVKCKTNDLCVPATAEIVLEGRITKQQTSEGPFMDLTETMDIVRQQPIIEIDCITHRHNPIFHALLPGGLEHKQLMGMPREPTIYAEVNKVAKCTGVYITPGGASWLHAVVQIEKQHPDDGRKAIIAAFQGHGSLKHVWVVDQDVDIYDPMQVEWAVATRFQSDHDLMLFEQMPGSSLDPSGIHVAGQKSKTAKMGLDCTMPLDGDPAKFQRGQYGDVNLANYLEKM